MFGKKKASSDTVLILDIEGGSVASALVSLAKAQPKILSYQRQHLPLTQSRSGAEISRALERVVLHSLRHSADVAARMRVHAPEQSTGQVHRAIVFLAAPWGTPNLEANAPKYAPGIRQFVKESIQAVFGDVTVSFYTAADALLHGSRAIGKEDALAVQLRGELLEMLLLTGGGVSAYSTVPLGSRSVLRTLQSHGGLSQHEARSRLLLQKHTDDFAYEPMLVAGRHLGDMFAESAQQLLPAGATASVLVIGEQPLGEWFAKNIASNPRVSELFSEDSIVEAFLPHHVANQVDLGAVHDPFVLLETLFVGDKQL